jgi:hypothetical protein
MIAFCLKCQQKVLVEEPVIVKRGKHNRFLYVGNCNLCGSKVSVIRQEANSFQDISDTGYARDWCTSDTRHSG